MSTFKLKQEYPNSPKLGTTIFFRRNSWKYYTIEDGLRTLKNLGNCSPEEYPNNWEKALRNAYEILSYRWTIDGSIWTPIQFAELEKGEGTGIKDLLEIGAIEIYSIKIDLTKEVLTLGDSVAVNPDLVQGAYPKVRVIEEFCVPTGQYINFKIKGQNTKFLTSVFTKKRELFTAEDGKVIYEGDFWYYYNPRTKQIRKTNTLEYKGSPENIVTTVKFSNLNAAQVYAKSLETVFVSDDGFEVKVGDTYYTVFLNNSKKSLSSHIDYGVVYTIDKAEGASKPVNWIDRSLCRKFKDKHNAELFAGACKALEVLKETPYYKYLNVSIP